MSLLTLNRGESGDNAIGPELFDAVGLIRTEELLMAGRYYGLDRQYFTTAIDYGFSKRLEEALVKWGRENVLRDMVRIIRTDRPFVLIARFQGNARDGHGNHEAAGLLTQEAFRVAGDPAVFPEQIRDGLRAVAAAEALHGRRARERGLDAAHRHRRVQPVARRLVSDVRAARARLPAIAERRPRAARRPGRRSAYYKRLRLRLLASTRQDAGRDAKENSFFDGIDTSIPGLFSAIRRPAPAGAAALLDGDRREVRAAVAAFSMPNPSASVPALARGLAATRAAHQRLGAEPDAVFVLRVKEQQFMDAINTALGDRLQAIAAVAGPVVPGQRVERRRVR